MKKIGFLFALAIANTIPAFSQLKHDNIWTIGYGQIGPNPSGGYPYGGMIMNCNASPPSFTLQDYVFDRPKAAISDKNGQLVAYTNGCMIVNRNHELMLNGDTLNPGAVFVEFCENGDYPLWQPVLFLPKPGSDSLYYLFHIRDDDYLWSAMNLMYSVVDASADDGNGAVISKNNSVLSDSAFLSGYVTATRHGNGRDWWVVVPRRFSNNKHVALLTTEGVEYKGMQNFDSLNLGIDSIYWASQTAFSADGSRYFHNSHKNLLMLDFDRCTGILSDPVRLDWDSIPFGGYGVATSPDSRFLYLSSGNTVQQYDLWAPDLAASMQVVAVYDGFLAPYPANFFQMMPGPDGKIYIISTYDNNVLHVIHNPDSLGLACKVEQHAITLPARTSYFIPNFANYNLGPLDGSPCDTLGLDNRPVAHFRWEAGDTLSPLQITFTDLSNHEPTTWLWDFGDGTTSQDTSPVHLYAAPGIYQVCLTVCNASACDTECREVEVKTVNTLTPQGEAGKIVLSPNPTTGLIEVSIPKNNGGLLTVYNLHGQKMRTLTVSPGTPKVSLDLSWNPNGLYWISLSDEAGKVVGTAKVSVSH